MYRVETGADGGGGEGGLQGQVTLKNLFRLFFSLEGTLYILFVTPLLKLSSSTRGKVHDSMLG